MTYRMYIDDLRIPKTEYILAGEELRDDCWIVVRSSQEAIDFVIKNGPPVEISFDHDLGGDDTSIQFIKWLIDYTIDHTMHFPRNFNVHSANPVGSENIKCLMNNFIDFLNGDRP